LYAVNASIIGCGADNHGDHATKWGGATITGCARGIEVPGPISIFKKI